ncbi:MAG: hypothetical protein EOL89_09280 [Actinobacteria bacterium]|nr:hypothetical protein [Actinomycetota bacterium]
MDDCPGDGAVPTGGFERAVVVASLLPAQQRGQAGECGTDPPRDVKTRVGPLGTLLLGAGQQSGHRDRDERWCPLSGLDEGRVLRSPRCEFTGGNGGDHPQSAGAFAAVPQQRRRDVGVLVEAVEPHHQVRPLHRRLGQHVQLLNRHPQLSRLGDQ